MATAESMLPDVAAAPNRLAQLFVIEMDKQAGWRESWESRRWKPAMPECPQRSGASHSCGNTRALSFQLQVKPAGQGSPMQRQRARNWQPTAAW